MSLSERADKLQKESGGALVMAPSSVKRWVLDLLSLVVVLAEEVASLRKELESNKAMKVNYKGGNDGNKTT